MRHFRPHRTMIEESLRDRPVGLWVMDGDPLRCRDLSGRGADASMTGTVYNNADGPSGFDGAYFIPENRFAIPPHADHNVTTAITLEFWILFGTTANRQIWNKVADSFYLRVINGQIGVFLNGVSSGWDYTTTSGPLANGQINDSKWHHVAVTWSQASGTLSIYVDGRLDSALARSGTISTGPNGQYVGYRQDEAGGQRGFDGLLQLLGLYASELGAPQIRRHWEAGARQGAIY